MHGFGEIARMPSLTVFINELSYSPKIGR
jgi:hypothetical protein